MEYIDIYQVVNSLKEKNKLETQEDTPEIIKNNLSGGVVFNGQLISIKAVDYFNKLINKPFTWYYFVCPKCKNNSKRIYSIGEKVTGCLKCSEIKTGFKVKTQADRILRIQGYLAQLFDKSSFITKKKKNDIIKNLVTHYNRLDNKYKFAYNTLLFKELQNWCLGVLRTDKSKDYKEAIKDMLEILRDSKRVMAQSGLIPTNKKEKF